MNYKKRILSIQKTLKKNELFFITDPSNIFYLSGFSGTFAKIILSYKKPYFFTDLRYEGVIRKLKLDKFYEVIITRNFYNDIKKIIKNTKEINIEITTPLQEYLKLKKEKKILKINSYILELRKIKDKKEIELIKKSIHITERGIKHIFNILKEGITEIDLKNEFEYHTKKIGADTVSFEPIIAFNENSAIPHHQASNKKLKKNSLILIDVGVKYHGYCSDLTRVIGFYIIKSHFSKIKNIYNKVKKAKEIGINFYINNKKINTAEINVRKFFEKENINELFFHSLGHGIGIDIHESPLVSIRSYDKFKKGMVVTCEPGIYLKNKFGIRLEDDYLITNKGIEKLSKMSDNILIKE